MFAGSSSCLSPSPRRAGATLYPYRTFAVGSAASVVAIGDLNGDGRADVAVATGFAGDPVNDRSVFVFLQKSDGTLAPPVRYSTGLTARGIAIGDLNGDGRADVAVCGDSGVAILLQQPDGTLGPSAFIPTGQDADSVVIGDLNGDGRADLAVSHSGEAQISVIYQTAAGGLAPPRQYPVPAAGFDQLAIGDITGDGLPDLVIMRGTPGRANFNLLPQDPVTHLLDSPGAFGWGITRTAHSFAIADLNGDGRLDVAATWGGDQPDCGVGLFYHGTKVLIQAPIQAGCSDSPEPIAVADMNGDGLLDLVVAHGGWQSLGTLIQQPDGSFTSETLDPLPYASHYEPQSLAIGDLNGDGRPDVALVDSNNGLVILYNAGNTDLAPPSTTILTGPPLESAGSSATFQFIGLDTVVPATRAAVFLEPGFGSLVCLLWRYNRHADRPCGGLAYVLCGGARPRRQRRSQPTLLSIRHRSDAAGEPDAPRGQRLHGGAGHHPLRGGPGSDCGRVAVDLRLEGRWRPVVGFLLGERADVVRSVRGCSRRGSAGGRSGWERDAYTRFDPVCGGPNATAHADRPRQPRHGYRRRQRGVLRDGQPAPAEPIDILVAARRRELEPVLDQHSGCA